MFYELNGNAEFQFEVGAQKMPSENIGSHLKLWTSGDGDRPNLLISAHGASVSRPQIGTGVSDIPGMGGWFQVPDWTTLHFFGPHKKALDDPGRRGIMNPGANNTVMHIGSEDAAGGNTIRNYRLTHFEEADSTIERQINDPTNIDPQFDLLQLRDRTIGSEEGATLYGYVGYTLKNVLSDLYDSNHRYQNIYCSFCRCTSLQILVEKMTLNYLEVPSHDAHKNLGSLGEK